MRVKNRIGFEGTEFGAPAERVQLGESTSRCQAGVQALKFSKYTEERKCPEESEYNMEDGLSSDFL